MALGLEDYRHRLELCLANAERCHGDAATIWREIARSYRVLIDLEEQALGKKPSAVSATEVL